MLSFILLFQLHTWPLVSWLACCICWVTLHKTSIVFHCELIRIIWLISQSVAVATGEWEMQTLGRWCLFRWFRGRGGAEGGFDAKVWLLTTERIYIYLIVIIVIVLWQDCTLTRYAGDSDMQIFELQTDSHIIQINSWWWVRWWHPFNANIKSLCVFKKFSIIILNVKRRKDETLHREGT